MNFLSEIITAVITGTSISATLIFIGRAFLKKYVKDIAALQNARELAFQKEVGKIEASLGTISELTRKVEEVKIEFERSKITYQIQFAKINERRIEILEKLYEKLFRLHEATKVITAFMHPINTDAEAEQKERLEEVVNAYNDFRIYFPTKMLYFPTEFNEMLSSISTLFWKCLWDSQEIARLRSWGATPEYLREGHKKLGGARASFEKEIPEALTKLDIECKKLLGIIETKEQ